MADTEIWERACERIGLCGLCSLLNRAEAFKAMINYLAPRYVIVKRMDPPEGQSLYQVNFSGWQPSLDLALAAAVLAVPQENQA